ncbi:ABC transporter substrate-binding protein, partial [Pseudomonas syringae pv. tagetis]
PARQPYNLSGAQRATESGISNSMVMRNPAVDTLIDGLVSAHTRNDMVLYARPLDRVLQWGYYVIPNYYSKRTPLEFA